MYTDSQLVAMQIEGTYETKEKSMVQYHQKAKLTMANFNKCMIQQIPRCENDRADALSKFGAIMSGIRDRKVIGIIKNQSAIAENVKVSTIKEPSSSKDGIVKYLKEGILVSDPVQAKRVKFKAILLYFD
ncbi:UNVERIFIED_CONTAM: hypothetical protein Sindi_0046600 [Sesamum indicum]